MNEDVYEKLRARKRSEVSSSDRLDRLTDNADFANEGVRSILDVDEYRER